VFEPFFTTKEPGKGTGLGLASVYGIVTQSGGAVEVTSEPLRGTQFDIYLPVTQDLPVPSQSWAEASPTAGGDETILVVDDEELVRRAAARMLRGAGYQVLEASSGSDALALFESHQGPIHLVVTDVIMPSMMGTELAARVVAAQREAKVLFTSGSSEVANGTERPDPTHELLEKPYSGPALLRTVRRTLDQPAPAKRAQRR